MKKNILVFPCGSEIGLEIHNALKYSMHVELFGASSIDDHGKFVYKNYIGGVPFVDEPSFINSINKIVKENNIDFIYPAHDSVVLQLAKNREKVVCKIIVPDKATAEICRSKLKTYQLFNKVIPCPQIYHDGNEVSEFPVFLKPEIGQGTKGTYLANSIEEVNFFIKKNPSLLISEYIPGNEYTVDCFTDRKGHLLFAGGRLRKRIQNGISVNTFPIRKDIRFEEIANVINRRLSLRGAWFFQVKEDSKKRPCLLEVAPRIAGSMALYRNLGVNFELLTIYDASDMDVEIALNNFDIEMDRALSNKFRINVNYNTVYVDLDDCLIINEVVNTSLITFLYQCLNKNKELFLITRHNKEIDATLKRFKLEGLFKEIYHLDEEQPKSSIIKKSNSIFIDDSFRERLEVSKAINIPVFSSDAIECLLD
jgi:predicted ATP-grasp superfamily ATP-dependent carboligase